MTKEVLFYFIVIAAKDFIRFKFKLTNCSAEYSPARMPQETNFYCFILGHFQPHNFQSLTNAQATLVG